MSSSALKISGKASGKVSRPRYRDISIGTRLFLSVRWHLTPYHSMAAKFPRSGRILDLGCGHGLLAMAMALEAPERQVLGIDHDLARVHAARKAAFSIPNLRFERGNLLEQPSGRFSGVSAIDVMHYFEPALQETIIDMAIERLDDGGILLIREVDPRGGGLASHFNRFYEKVATATGFTQAEKPGLHFRSPEDWISLLQRKGFETHSERCSSRLFADILYVCRKRASS